MHILGYYSAAAVALAIAALCVAGCSNSAPIYSYGFEPADGGASLLPPAAVAADQPLYVDSGYNPNYYWNRPHYAAATPNYAGDYYYGRYGSEVANDYGGPPRGYVAGYGYGQGSYGEYESGYSADYTGTPVATYGNYYDQRLYYLALRERERREQLRDRERRRQEEGRAPAREMDRSMERHAVVQPHDGDTHARGATDNRGHGFNGHDAKMFEGTRNPTPAGARIQNNKSDVNERPEK